MNTNEVQNGCTCSNDNIVIACSGACDLGQISDLVARRLRDNKIRKMNCLAAIGANIQSTIDTFKLSNILLIDGCSIDCGKKILDNANITNYQYIRITDMGFIKGKTMVTDEVIDSVYEKATSLI